jgi:hypothetical protein
MEDWGMLQTVDPGSDNYVTVRSSNGVGLSVEYSPFGQSVRPRMKNLIVRVTGGYLSPGDTITIVFGDTSIVSEGWCLQPFAKSVEPELPYTDRNIVDHSPQTSLWNFCEP